MRIRNDKYENLQRQKLKAAILGSPAQKKNSFYVLRQSIRRKDNVPMEQFTSLSVDFLAISRQVVRA